MYILAHDKESFVGHEEKQRPNCVCKQRKGTWGEQYFIPPGVGVDRILELERPVVNLNLTFSDLQIPACVRT